MIINREKAKSLSIWPMTPELAPRDSLVVF
jgi:hypothetical protein